MELQLEGKREGGEFELIYKVALDPAPTLTQAAQRSGFSCDRPSGRPVELICLEEGVSLQRKEIVLPDDFYAAAYRDENYMLYSFEGEDGAQAGAPVRGQDTEGSGTEPDQYSAVKLYRMRLDGAQKQVIFRYDYDGKVNGQAQSAEDVWSENDLEDTDGTGLLKISCTGWKGMEE